MDQNLVDDIVLAAAREVMFDADARFAAWRASRREKAVHTEDLPGTGSDLGVNLFDLLNVLANTVLGQFAIGFASGAIANFATSWLEGKTNGLSKSDLIAIGKIVEEKCAAEQQKNTRPPSKPRSGAQSDPDESR